MTEYCKDYGFVEDFVPSFIEFRPFTCLHFAVVLLSFVLEAKEDRCLNLSINTQ